MLRYCEVASLCPPAASPVVSEVRWRVRNFTEPDVSHSLYLRTASQVLWRDGAGKGQMVGKGRDRGRQENLTSVSLFQKKKGGGAGREEKHKVT